MERINIPANCRERAATIAAVAEALAAQCEIISVKKLSYAANWKPEFARRAMEWYAGLLSDSRRAAYGYVPPSACWPLSPPAPW